MIVITLTDCPISLRGDLTKWLIEINTGVFVGKVSARVRDNLWKRVVENIKNGRATLVYNTNNEQRMDFRIHHSENEIIDFDGLKLVMKPSPARTKNLTKRRMGFSKASKMRMIKRKQNGNINLKDKTSEYPNTYTILDLETTGLNPNENEIIEVGMLKINHNEILDQYHVLLHPNQAVSKQIEKLTGITNETLRIEGKHINDVLSEIKNFIGKDVLLGHNILFDIDFLNQAYLENAQSKMNNQYYDTMTMYNIILNGQRRSKKLADIASYYDISVNERHRSLADCYTIKAVYDVLKNELKKQSK
jgi:CRISPR-associated protein Cas2